MSVVIPVILCGGSGTRLWPLSRSDRPKQFISLGHAHTLLEGTLLRGQTIAGAGDPLCVTAAAYGAEVRQSLDRLGLPGRLLLEPEPRNTAPALCAAALVAMRTDPGAVIVALPADHIIEDGGSFAASIAHAVAAAEIGWLTVLGVRPRRASSALGYIVPAAAIDGVPQVTRVSRFVEKPEPELAESLVAAGALWNAGIVVARADAVIEGVRKHEPAVLMAVERSLAAGGGEAGDVQLGAKDFAAAPRISFDKAVLERHEAVAVAALEAMWRDVGTWAEVAELYPADGEGNRKTGRVRLTSSRDTFVFSPNRLTVGIGLKDLVVVDTPDALLIAHRNDLGLMREAVEALAAAHYPEVAAGDRSVSLDSRHEKVDFDEVSRAFRVSLAPGETTRCEARLNTSRFWIVLEGKVNVLAGKEVFTYVANQSFHASSALPHTIANAGSEPAKLIEVHIMGSVTH